MKPSLIPSAVRTCFAAKMVPYFQGPPGVGKTDTIRALQPDYGEMIIVHGLTHDPADVHGFPKIVEIEGGEFITRFSRPGFWPLGERGIIFYDEFPSAPPMTQSAFSQMLLHRRIGEHILKDGWHQIAAGNRMTDRAIVHPIPSNIANRMIFIDFDVDLDDWTAASIAANKRAEVIAYIRFAPDALHEFDPMAKRAKDKSTEHAFPSPRTWWFISDLMDQNPDPRIEADLYMGTVGKGRGSTFLSFLKMYRNAPSLDAILLDPNKAPIPKDLSVKYAVALGLSRRMDAKNARHVITYLERYTEVDMNVMAIKLATERDSTICNTKEFQKWSLTHKETLFVQEEA